MVKGVREINAVAMTIIIPRGKNWPSQGRLNQRPPILNSCMLSTELRGFGEASSSDALLVVSNREIYRRVLMGSNLALEQKTTRCVCETLMPPKHPSFEKHDPLQMTLTLVPGDVYR